MKFGIKRKLLLVLVGSLMLTSVLHVLLASHFTNRQNEDSAFALLRLDLLAWQNELQDLTLQLREAALAAVGDQAVLNNLAELVALEFKLEGADASEASRDTARTLAYLKSVSINRLHLVLRTSGFSSISVYSRGKLSHHVSAGEGGMMIRRSKVDEAWVTASTDAGGNLPTSAWPAWHAGTPKVVIAVALDRRPGVAFDFSSAAGAILEVAVPVQGVIEEVVTDADVQPTTRFVSDVAIAGRGGRAGSSAPRPAPATFAVVVFRKLIGRAELEKVAARTGKLPALLSPAGDHRQQLDAHALPAEEALQQVRALPPEAWSQGWQGIVTNEQGSYYAALRPWAFENQPALVLGLATSREPTLQNIRQTVVASLAAAGLILLLSLAAGMWLVGRLINPVVALTAAVKAIGARGRSGAAPGGDGPQSLAGLRPVAIEAPDEVGELTRAFNAMIIELRSTLETLEQRVSDRTAELHLQTRYLRELIDTLPMVVWLKDTGSRYLAVNQAHADACGRSVDEMVGKSDFDLWPSEIAQAHGAEDAEVMASRQRKTVEKTLAAPDGTVWIETCRAPVLDEDGTVLGTVGASRDISERKAAEAAREAALAEAERLARLRSDFLAQMSHELRTPLNGILGYAQILRRDKTLNEKQAEGLKVIQQSGEHLLTLINDILDLAKIEAGKLTLCPEDFAPAGFLRVIAEIIRVKAEEKQLDFICDPAPDLPTQIRADEKRLRQVLLNLLSNAVKFTDHGRVTLRARFMPPARLCFEVRDTGIGIPDHQLDAIFRPFEQAGDVQRRAGGTGLGLAISQQLVRQMGGEIRVSSRLGEGSTFSFEIDVTVALAEKEAEASTGNVSGYSGPRKTVLVVDDVAENRRVLADMLSPLGFTLLEAANGRAGLEQSRTRRPDIILMDLLMPEMDGLEAIRCLRSEAELAQVPVIVISASASGSDERDSLAAGANAFLPKPVDLERLLIYLGDLLKLEWRYDLPPAQAVSEGESFRPLVPPPPAEMMILHRLALLGNMQDIVRRTEHVAGLDECYQPFAARLRQLAQGYQSKALLKLVEQYMDEKATG